MSETFPVAVYAHFGSAIPMHLKFGLKRHRSIFPDQRVVLLVDQFVKGVELEGIEIYEIDSLNLQKELFDSMSKHLDFNFRGGFWKYTLQRIFALSEFHKSCPETNVIHIESDVLVMPEFPWKKFNHLKTLAWLRVNEEVDVAAVVFLPNYRCSNLLSSEVARFAMEKPSINDMEALHRFAIENPSDHVYLPSLTPDNSRSSETFQNEELGMLNYFEGIFDPLILGLWNFGQDPKNSFGIRRRYVDDSNHHLSPESVQLKYSDGVLLDQNGVHVFSLHLHSKYLPLFGPNWESALKDGLNQSATKIKNISFHVTALFAAIKGRRLKENVWILLASIPGVSIFRKIHFFENLKNRIKKRLKI